MNSKYPTIKQTVILLILMVVLMVLFGFLAGIIIHILELEKFKTVINGLVNIFAIGIFLLYGVKRTKCSCKALYPFKSFNVFFIFPIIIMMSGSSIILSEIDNVFRIFVPMPDSIMKIFLGMSINSGSVIGSVFLLGIVAPFTEELLFRGLILQSFLNQYSQKKSVIMSSLLFACFHLNPWQFIGPFLLGIIFSLLFIKYKSLVPSLIGHSVFNLIPIIVTNMFDIKIKGYNDVPFEINFQPLWFNITGITLIMIGVILSILIFRNDKSGRLAVNVPGEESL